MVQHVDECRVGFWIDDCIWIFRSHLLIGMWRLHAILRQSGINGGIASLGEVLCDRHGDLSKLRVIHVHMLHVRLFERRRLGL
jgi:hypothetical protein